jgi:hypothetical protein
MSQLLARILLMSDSHWMVVPPEEQKGTIAKGWDRLFDWLFFWRQKRKNNQNFRLALLKTKEHIPFDKLIFTGDLIECVFNERGIITPEDVAEIATLKNFILHVLGNLNPSYGTWANRPIKGHFLPGDHEFGYKLPLSTDPESGMSLNSVENFQRILGPLFDAWKIRDFHFITISSSLFIQSTDHLETDEQMQIWSLRKEQQKFLIEYLLNVPSGQKVFLFLHDPDAIELIDTLPGAEKITKVFCGHIHTDKNFRGYRRIGKLANSFWGRLLVRVVVGVILNRWQRANKIITWAKGNTRRLELFEKYNLQIVPAVCETLGFLVLELYDDGNYEIKKFTS